MFGSATMILLLPLAFVTDSMWVFWWIEWVGMAVSSLLPFCFKTKPGHPRFHAHTVLVCQTLFSAIQAGLGFLVVLGKQV